MGGSTLCQNLHQFPRQLQFGLAPRQIVLQPSKTITGKPLAFTISIKELNPLRRSFTEVNNCR